MRRTLMFKEFREIGWMGAIAMVIHSIYLVQITSHWARFERLMWGRASYSLTPDFPFINWDPEILFLVNTSLAILLAVAQTFGESARKTWHFYLYRPVSRDWLILVKLLNGLGVLLVSTGLPYLVYALWAATPGTHPHPFEWWMTDTLFRCWFSSSIVYLATFLCGLREARWWGSRFWMVLPPVFLFFAINSWPWFPLYGWVSMFVMAGVLISATLGIGRARDFA